MTDCWAKLSKTKGSFNTTLNVYFGENDTLGSRSVKIRVKSKDGLTSSEFTLVQKKGNITI